MDVFEALTQELSGGRPAVLVTVVAVEGDPPSHPGAKLLVVDGAVVAGTLGCSEFDAAGRELAASLTGVPTLRRRMVFGHGTQQALDLFAERHDPQPGITIVGATPVGHALAALAESLNRRVRLLEDDPVAVLREQPLGPADAVIVSDHDAPYVDEVLRTVLAGEAAFVGMLGSRRHAPEVVGRLRDAGVSPKYLARLHSPCGLDIGSRSPPEIALSIIAEVVAAERGRSGGPMSVDWSVQRM